MIGNEVRPKILPQYLDIALIVVAAVRIGKRIEYMKHLVVVCCVHMRQRETDWTLTMSSLIMDTQQVSETLVSNNFNTSFLPRRFQRNTYRAFVSLTLQQGFV
jgi:hypothetical protein